jgi:hypothetical protein
MCYVFDICKGGGSGPGGGPGNGGGSPGAGGSNSAKPTVFSCWHDFHQTAAGKGIAFLSVPAILDNDWKKTFEDWIALPALKFAAFWAAKQGANAASQEFWSVVKGTVQRIPGPTEIGVTTGETVLKRVALPAIVSASAADLFALANCGDKVNPPEHFPAH